jgi:hypothetical protein
MGEADCCTDSYGQEQQKMEGADIQFSNSVHTYRCVRIKGSYGDL